VFLFVENVDERQLSAMTFGRQNIPVFRQFFEAGA